ncbi:MAG TPA: cation transporter [Paracoccaceae bacterium]|nr:cation transporter [Paracoccaceae bacterium]
METSDREPAFRRAVRWVALANFGYFGVEGAVALAIGSVALFADSVDFLEDASLNLLILLALGWSLAARARLGQGLALLLLVPSAAALWTAIAKIADPAVPEPLALGATGAGALAVNLGCALLLARFRRTSGSLARAAFLSARNDALANLGIIGAGLVSATIWPSAWPDILVGLAIGAVNLDAAREVWTAARREQREARG